MTPDVDLVADYLAGDRNAGADLIQRHASAVYAACLGILADPDQAQDAAQETLLKGMKKLGTLQDGSLFRSWIISIAYNLCRDSRRQATRRKELLDQHLGLSAVATVNAHEMAVPGLGTGIAAQEASDGPDLRLAMARLPEKYRIPLLLFYFDGLNTASVAEALEISPTGAATRLCRARRALRAILEVGHD